MKRFLLATVTVALALTLVGGAAFAEDGTTSTSNSDGSTATTTTSTTHADDGDTVTTTDTTVTNTTVQGPSSGSDSTTTTTQACSTGGDGREKPGFAMGVTTYPYGWTGSGFDLSVSGNTTPTGQVRFILDGKNFTSATLDNTGSAIVSLPRTLSAGHHTADVVYYGDTSNAPAKMSDGKGPWSGLVGLDIPKALSATSIVAPKSVSRTRHATVRVRVRSLGSNLRPTGTVKVYVGKKRVRTVSLRPSAHGNLTIRLPKMTTGHHKISAVFTGGHNHEGSKSTTKRINVKR